MKQISGKDFAKLLKKHGWVLARTKGSHHILTKEGYRERIVVPVHSNTPLKLGLLRSLMKISGISEKEL